jgi:putative ABC transport system ATP-binding protein
LGQPLLRLIGVWKRVGPEYVLRGLGLDVGPGEVIVIYGRSGVGKTSLARIAALLDVPDKGQVLIRGVEASGLPEHRRAAIRLHYIGYVDQFYTLIPGLTLWENIELAPRILGTPRSERKRIVEYLVEELGLQGHEHKLPSQLSGGQRQRAAIARALAKQPSLLVMDEPFSSLDEENTHRVMRLVEQLVTRRGGAAIITTTSIEDMSAGTRCYHLSQGTMRPASCRGSIGGLKEE